MPISFLRGNPTTAQALVDLIERAVADGDVRRGERLPPVRELAAAAALAPNTVAAAYRTLNQRGVAVGRGRAGTFVAGNPPLTGPEDLAPASGTIDVTGGGPDPDLLIPLAPALSRIDASPVLYGADPCEASLRPWAHAWAVPAGLSVERVAVVGGALDGVERVLLSHTRPGDRIAVEDPGYSAVFDLIAALGLVAVPVRIDDEGLLPDALAQALDRGGAGGIIVTPRAHNPTGAALSETRRAELSGVLAAHPDTLLIEDDHAGPISGAPSRSLISAERRSWAAIASVAKSLGPDLRLAFLAADRVTLDRVEGRQQLGTGWVSHLLQRIVAEVLSEEGTEAGLAAAAEHYRRRRTLVTSHLRAHGLSVWGSSGLNVWVPVDAEGPAVNALAQRGRWVRSGQRYRLQSPPGIRLSVAAVGEDRLQRLAEDVVAVVQHTRRPRRSG